MSSASTDSKPTTIPKTSSTTTTAKPPPIPTITPPPIQHYGSVHSGSPEDQSFARIQARNTKQIALNNAHKGGARRRRHQRGGSTTAPEAGGTANDEIVVPQSNTGVHVAGPQNSNSASVVGNTTLAKGTMASQYDNQVEFTPTSGYAGSPQAAKTASAQGETATPPKSAQSGGRRRHRGAPLPTYAEMLRDNPWMLKPDMIKQTRKMYPEMFHAKARHHRMVYRKRTRTKKRKKRRKRTTRRRKRTTRRRKRTKRGGCTFCLSGGRRRRRRTNRKKRTRKKSKRCKYCLLNRRSIW